MARIDGISRKELDVAYGQESPNQRLDVFLPRMARIDGISRKELDVAYGQESSNQRLNVFLPESGDGPFPALIYTHGGGFASVTSGTITWKCR